MAVHGDYDQASSYNLKQKNCDYGKKSSDRKKCPSNINYGPNITYTVNFNYKQKQLSEVNFYYGEATQNGATYDLEDEDYTQAIKYEEMYEKHYQQKPDEHQQTHYLEETEKNRKMEKTDYRKTSIWRRRTTRRRRRTSR